MPTRASSRRRCASRRTYRQILKRDDGSTKNVSLIDKQNIHNNRLQVINQYEVAQSDGGAARSNRYDVTVLVNGLPMVHIELKRRGVHIREAFNQIDRYQRDSFWAGSGLFDYVQLFVISNGTLTKYYSNTTRHQHLSEVAGSKRARKTSNSFEFTSWWADATNRPIQELTSFAKCLHACCSGPLLPPPAPTGVFFASLRSRVRAPSSPPENMQVGGPFRGSAYRVCGAYAPPRSLGLRQNQVVVARAGDHVGQSRGADERGAAYPRRPFRRLNTSTTSAMTSRA